MEECARRPNNSFPSLLCTGLECSLQGQKSFPQSSNNAWCKCLSTNISILQYRRENQLAEILQLSLLFPYLIKSFTLISWEKKEGEITLKKITSPYIPRCAIFYSVEMKIQDQYFLPQPKNWAMSQDCSNNVRNLLAALLQSSSALGFEEQLCFCFPGRETVSSQCHNFIISALTKKLTPENKSCS